MASALEQFVNNVRQLSAQGRATKLIRRVVLARQLAYAIYCLTDSKTAKLAGALFLLYHVIILFK